VIILLVKNLTALLVFKPESKKPNISFAKLIVQLKIGSQFTPKFMAKMAKKKKRETKKREKK